MMANMSVYGRMWPSLPASVRCLPFALLVSMGAVASEAAPAELDRLLKAYPDHLSHIEDNMLVWRDGTRMALDDGHGQKSFEDWLDHPDIADTLMQPYPAGARLMAPERNVDPGRARNAAFFDKMYGNCREGNVEKSLTQITWLPKKARQKLRVTRINNVDEKLARISAELEALPAKFDVFLSPSAGAYNCRRIAGTQRPSAHSYGIAIDIALKHADYWRNARPKADGSYAYRNEIPPEIVAIFEKHGFIWGGRWYHYDTMHFEYRPELLPADGD